MAAKEGLDPERVSWTSASIVLKAMLSVMADRPETAALVPLIKAEALRALAASESRLRYRKGADDALYAIHVAVAGLFEPLP